jgi:hypothetical protein
MDRPILAAAVAAFAACLATTAWAEDRPVLGATREAVVTYRIVGPDSSGHTMQISYSPAGKLRVDNPGRQGYSVFDRGTKLMTMVMPDQRMYLEMSVPQVPGLTEPPTDSAHFARKGNDTVAGTPCTIWVFDDGKRQGESCITQDGLALRGIGKEGRGIEATKVVYGTLSPDTFTIPAGFQKVEMPRMGGPGGMGGPGAGAPGMGAPGMGGAGSAMSGGHRQPRRQHHPRRADLGSVRVRRRSS